ncbi:hypothetical protein BDW22DRAFT_1433443 [Trametopsis cervina]|nr:hypothetical protein BDW22DRAFT_1433443 [Trametopsis cervina]
MSTPEPTAVGAPLASAPADIPALVGVPLVFGFVVAMLYGAISVQTYMYFHNNPRDSLVLKRTMFSLWIIDTISTAFSSLVVYYYCVRVLMNPLLLSRIPWADGACIILTSFSDFIVSCIFAYRIRALYGRIWPLIFVVPPTTLACLGGTAVGIATSVGVTIVITNALIPNTFYFQGLAAMLPKLMLNSLLAMLNSRDTMRSKMSPTSGALSIHLTQLGRNRFSLESRTEASELVNPNLHTAAVEMRVSKASSVEALQNSEDPVKV